MTQADPTPWLHNDPEARVADAERRAVLEAAQQQGPPGLAPVAGVTLLVLMCLYTAWAWALVDRTPVGRENYFRDYGCIIVLGLAGLRITVARGRHVVSAVAAAVAGLVLLAGPVFSEHHSPSLVVVEVVFGVLAVACAVVTVVSPRQRGDDRGSNGRRNRHRA